MGSLKGGSISKIDIKSLLSATSASPDPHPRDFERFINSVLREYNIRDITVKVISKDEDPSIKTKKEPTSAPVMGVFSRVNVSRSSRETYAKVSARSDKQEFGSSMSNAETVTKISAFYENEGQLTEVGFIKCQRPVPMIVFDAIYSCLAHHPHLTRITWNGNYLTGAIICQISKMLIVSFITEVILDNSRAPEQNYYVLLNSANLKYLSLRSCGVDDEVCEKIAERIQRHRPGENLVALNLAVNLITDRGAKALGHALRTNRRLSFLNLCCNKITSDGAAHILLPLIKFPLNPDEIMEVRLKKFELAKHRIEIKVDNKVDKVDRSRRETEKSRVILGDITNLDKKAEKKKNKAVKNGNVRKGQTEKTTDSEGTGPEVQTEKTTDSKGIGADDDIFTSNLKLSSGVWFSLGNMTLCSLNLAYNQLDFNAVSKIADVLSYQYCEGKSPKSGLMRVVIEGNLLPKECPNYQLIDKYMNIALDSVSTVMTENLKSNKPIRNLNKKKK